MSPTTPPSKVGKKKSTDWARGGLFQRPRLRAKDKLDPNPGGLSSTEQFFNVCFCAAFGVGNVTHYLVVEQDTGEFLAYFFAWWSAWVIGSEYASRYNNVDFTHMVFWSLYGLMCANMLMHTNHGVQGPNAYGFCLSCAGIHAVVGLMTLRVALYVPEAKVSGCWHGGWMLMMTNVWVMAAVLPSARGFCWGLAVALEPISSTLFLLKYQQHLVPITKQYQVNKFAIICVLALGSSVAAAVGGVDPSQFSDTDKPWVEISSFFGFVQFMMFKFLVVDVDTVPIDDHAISRSFEWRAAWRVFQPALILAMVGSSAGLATLLEVVKDSGIETSLYANVAREQFGRRISYWYTAAFFALLVMQRQFFHLVPEHILAHKNLTRQRHFGTIVQMTVAVALFIWPLAFTSSGLALHVRDVGTLAFFSTMLVIMHLVLKKKELAVMTNDEMEAVYEQLETGHGDENYDDAVEKEGEEDHAVDNEEEEQEGDSRDTNNRKSTEHGCNGIPPNSSSAAAAAPNEKKGTTWEAATNINVYDKKAAAAAERKEKMDTKIGQTI